MIVEKEGCIFSTDCQVIVNPVNLVGVMGAGTALEMKMIFPKMFERYREFCKNKQFNLGQLWLWKNSNKWWVLNFPTKEHWKDKSTLENIELGLKKFVESYEKLGITSIAFPHLGCLNGGLEWDNVKPLMEQYLDPLPIKVEIWKYSKFKPDPIWMALKDKCVKEQDTIIKRIVIRCFDFKGLKDQPGVGKEVQNQIGPLIGIETV